MSLAELRDNEEMLSECSEDILSEHTPEECSEEHQENNLQIPDNNEEISSEYECLICKDLLCEPVVLLCQHSYCMDCITTHYNKKVDYNLQMGIIHIGPDEFKEGHNKCPACKFPFTLPPKYNNNLESSLSHLYPEKYAARKEYVKLKAQLSDVEKKMRLEVWNMMCSKTPNVNDDPETLSHYVYPYPANTRSSNFYCPSDFKQQSSQSNTTSIWSITKSIFNHPFIYIPFLVGTSFYFLKKMNHI